MRRRVPDGAAAGLAQGVCRDRERVEHTRCPERCHLRGSPGGAGKEVSAPQEPGDTRLAAMLAFIKAHGQITAAEVRELLHLQRSQGLRVLKSWERQGRIVVRGRGRGVHYVLPGTGTVTSAGLRCHGGEGEGQRGRELEVARVQAVQARATLPARLQVAVRIAAEAGRVTRAEYAKVSQRTAKRDLAELVRVGVLRAEGKGKRQVYVPG
jgi:predicted HTH transcriptional regulator